MGLRFWIVAVFALGPISREVRAQDSRHLVDDFGDTVVVGARPARIASLNPTTTELLFALGAGARLVGRTTYDVLPPAARAVPDLGPGLRPNVEAIIAAQPQLVLLYASADNRDAARRLRASGVTTASYRVDRISDFARVTRMLGLLIGDTLAAKRTIDSVQTTLDRVRVATQNLPRVKVFWPFWDSPLMSVGRGSFVNELIDIAGGRNVFDDLPQPSPVVTFETLLLRDPDVLVTGAGSRGRMMESDKWRALRAVRDGHVVVPDSNTTIGPSAHVGNSAVLLARLLHPGIKL